MVGIFTRLLKCLFREVAKKSVGYMLALPCKVDIEDIELSFIH